MTPSDDHIIGHGAAEAAIQRLVDEYGGQLFNLAHRFCGSREEAEDLVQEVFLQAFRSWGEFRGEADPRTWLFRIAARSCQRMHRRRSGEPEQIGSLDALLPFGDPLIAVIADDQPDAVQEQIHAEALRQLESEIAQLPDEFRVPLLLKDIVGFSVKEVADVLGLEEGTVRSRVHRARLKLRSAVDRALPRAEGPAPPPAYEERTCLDLLNAKQEALDRGAPFDTSVICQRCRSVFASLDLTHRACRELAGDAMPDEIRQRLLGRLGQPS
ncbi:MAG: sigma-70 family RNA polymerase sigma factor [Phycisphaeraceae bacterium]|nr:sigma-70 family RNA polymerase sigma factor [Phycisphaeraceae bacterium]